MVPQVDDITLTAADIDAAVLDFAMDREEDAELALDAADTWRARAWAWAIVAALEFVALAWVVWP